MPIKWSALKVSEAMDSAEGLINQAVPYLEQAKTVAIEARKIAHLPQYMGDRLAGLEEDIRRTLERLKSDIYSIRKDIPDGAMEAEQETARHGSQQSLI